MNVRAHACTDRTLYTRAYVRRCELHSIVYYYERNFNPPTIQKILFEEGLTTTRQGIARFLKIYLRMGSIDRRRGSGRPSKASTEVREIIEEEMRRDDETTAV